jgi:hypothetical protein
MTRTARADQGVLVSVGPCPVCGSFAPVLVLVGLADEQLVYFCPGCETAWRTPPVFPVLDAVDSLETVAPLGVRLPTHDERSQLKNATSIEYDTWRKELDRILERVS